MKHRIFMGLFWLCTAWPALAEEPLPYAAYQSFVRELYAHWYLPQSRDFMATSEALQRAMDGLCEGEAGLQRARAQWLTTVAQWERFSAVRGGALLARRSPREIDFMPTRPEAIARAIAAAPADLRALDEIGSPAKGLPALEWLLWRRPQLDAGTCAYARQVTAAVRAEAGLLLKAYEKSLADDWDESAAEYAMYEFLNLWASGLQKLWWEELDRPLQKAGTSRAPLWSRAASGHSRAGWLQQWAGLSRLAVGPAPSLRHYLLAQGQPEAAANLQQQVAAVEVALARLDGLDGALDGSAGRAGIKAALLALQGLQQFAEGEMATALHFVISFFDEDGD